MARNAESSDEPGSALFNRQLANLTRIECSGDLRVWYAGDRDVRRAMLRTPEDYDAESDTSDRDNYESPARLFPDTLAG
jgi:hypothetical protein